MTDTGEDARSVVIRQMQSRGAAAGSGAAAPAASFFGLWQQTAGQLEPVIGARGVDALFGRALHVTARRFPWLPTAADGSSVTPRDVFQTCLAGRSASEASDAGETLLLTFTGLLAGMVGESLTARLLGDGWIACDTHAQSKSDGPVAT